MNHRDLYLRFFHEITKSPFLHYGYWSPEETPSLDNLVRAQKKYVDVLLEMIPSGVQSVLDIGCGIGGVTQILVEKSFLVNAITTDLYQCELFKKKTKGTVPVRVSRWENYKDVRTYDLLMMCESAQYFLLDACFKQSRKFCKAGGWLLVSDYFLKSEIREHPITKSGHSKAHFIKAAEENGFRLVKSQNISMEVKHTLDLARKYYESLLMPTTRFILEMFKASSKRYWLGFRNVIASYEKELTEFGELLDSDAFLRFKEYLILLFRRE